MKQPTLILLTLLTTSTARKQGKQSSLLTLPTFPSSNHNLHSIDYSRYSPPGLRSYDPSDPNTSCYFPLYESDLNQDGVVGHAEYLEFIEALEPRLGNAESFRDLAFVLKVNFVYLSCLCEDGGNNCCKVGGDGSIFTAGSSPDETPTESQIQYLDTVCSTTQASIDYALKELPPTLQPTEEPTANPSYVPTDSPVVAPSVSPSFVPTAGKVVDTDAPTYMERTDSPVLSTDAPFGSSAPNTSPGPTPSNGNVIPPTSSTGEPTLATFSPSFTNPPSMAPSMTDRAIGGGSEDNTTTTTLSSGGIAGIVIASVAVIAAGIFVSRKRTRNEEDPSLEFKGDKDLEMGDLGDGPDPGPSPTNADVDSTSAAPDIVPPSPDRLNTLQLSPPLSPAFAAGPYSPERLDLDSDDDSSSSAGQSGWSSSQGLSSLNTASFDAGEDGSMLSGGAAGRQMAGGSALAAIGVASAVTYNTVNKSSPPQKMVKQRYGDDNDDDGSISSEEGMAAAVSRKDLDAAIEAGDWAAVGATAALLAHTTDQGSSSKDPQVAERDSRVSDMDYSRTNELDKLVEAGDWEGVVLAAAQFEGESDADDGTRDQVLDDGSEPSLLARGRDQKLESIRNEVELLVRRIVPDELDNIDEMMIQFEGREHELIETLKTMQERSIAQRARAAVQQSAKLEAKARGHVSSDGGGGSTSSASKSYIEQAIEKGDWQAVGQAAAMMGGGQVIEDDSFDRSRSSSISSSLSDSRSRSASRDSTLSRDKSERIQHLDNLIAVGDWAGIVAVASQYQAMDEEIGQSPPVDANLATEEERDALAQAEMWRAIAQQSRQDISSTSEGAKEAADWAISRSLAKHSAPASSVTDQPDTKISKIETYEDDDQSV